MFVGLFVRRYVIRTELVKLLFRSFDDINDFTVDM